MITLSGQAALRAVIVAVRGLTFLLLVKLLPVADFALVSLCFTYVGFAVTIASLGCDQVVYRVFSKSKQRATESRDLSKIYGFVLGVAIVISLLFFLITFFWLSVTSIYLTMTIPLAVTLSFKNAVLLASGRMRSAQIIELCNAAIPLFFIAGFSVLQRPTEYNEIFIIYFAGWIAAFLLSERVLPSDADPQIFLSPVTRMRYARRFLHFGAKKVAVLSVARVDMILIPMIKSHEIQAGYFILVKIFELLQQFTEVVNSTFLRMTLLVAKRAGRSPASHWRRLATINFFLQSLLLIMGFSLAYTVLWGDPKATNAVKLAPFVFPSFLLILTFLHSLQMSFVISSVRWFLKWSIVVISTGISFGLIWVVRGFDEFVVVSCWLPLLVLLLICARHVTK